MAELHLPKSLTANVYSKLRGEILSARLRPGQKLKIEDLCLRFSAGSSAVREALSRLAAENFVTLEPQKGFRVTPLSIDELRDLTRTRAHIEGLCLRDSIHNGDIEWESRLLASAHRLANTPVGDARDDKVFSEGYVEAHTAFHETLVSACQSKWLCKLRHLLFIQSERYRHLSRPFALKERDLDKEHRAIADAALARETDLCVALMAKHLTLTADILIEAAQRGTAPLSLE